MIASRRVFALLAISVVACMPPDFGIPGAATGPRAPAAAPACAAFLADSTGGGKFERIDPRSLADLTGVPDSEAAQADRGPAGWLVGHDGRQIALVSHYGYGGASKAFAGPNDAEILTVVGRVDARDAHCRPVAEAGDVLYALVTPRVFTPANSFADVVLLALDAVTGTELWRLRTGIPAKTGSYPDGVYAWSSSEAPQLHPAAALSPDRRSIAVLHPEEDRIVFIDLSTRKLRTLSIRREVSLLERLGVVLVAEAKGPEQVSRSSLLFSRDGQRLFALRHETAFFNPGRLRVMTIDVRSGDIVGRFPKEGDVKDETPVAILESPDGTALFLVSRRSGDSYTVRSFDRDGLRMVGERRFDRLPFLRFLPLAS